MWRRLPVRGRERSPKGVGTANFTVWIARLALQ